MSAVVRRRIRVGGLLAIAALSLGPVLVAAPATATETSSPVASEPPGGATCVAGSADCGQETGDTSSSVSATPTTSPSSTPAVTTLPDTGSAPRTGPAPRQLAHTGGSASTGWGYTGTGLLVGGTLIVLATRRRSDS
jgi:LPXTG-motif cell wall-anchored protein